MIHWYEISRISKPIDTESGLVVTGSWERENEECLQLGTILGVRGWKCSGIKKWWWLQNLWMLLKNMKLHTLNGWIVDFLNYISIKMFFFKITSDGCTKMGEDGLRVYSRWDPRTLETGIVWGRERGQWRLPPGISTDVVAAACDDSFLPYSLIISWWFPQNQPLPFYPSSVKEWGSALR